MTSRTESGPGVGAEASILPAASPYNAHDLMETYAAHAGKDQGRAPRDAGAGRPEHSAPNRTRAAFAQGEEGALNAKAAEGAALDGSHRCIGFAWEVLEACPAVAVRLSRRCQCVGTTIPDGVDV